MSDEPQREATLRERVQLLERRADTNERSAEEHWENVYRRLNELEREVGVQPPPTEKRLVIEESMR